MTIGMITHDMSARPGHVPSLDGLRAISISLVLAAHFIDARIFPGGLGVFVFFVISGFLITRLLIIERNQRGRNDLGKFYARRALRLYPVIVAYAAAIISADAALGRAWNWLEPASALAYFANYWYVHIGPQATMPFGIFWSLSIEEHFYLLFPAVFCFTRGKPARLLASMAVVIAGCLMARIIANHAGVSSEAIYSETQYRLDSIAFGVALAAAAEFPRGQHWLQHLARPAALLTALAAIGACLVERDAWFRETIRYSIEGGAIAVIIAGVLFGDYPRAAQAALNHPGVRWIGRLSYSLYVWHLGVASYLDTGWPAPAQAVVSLAASLAAAVASYYLIEQPFLRLRRRVR